MRNYISFITGLLRRFEDSRRRARILMDLRATNPTCKIESVGLQNVELGNKVVILSEVRLDQVQIGDFSYISNNSKLVKVKIGKFCSIGPRIQIGLAPHPAKVFVSTYPGFYSNQNTGCIHTFREDKVFDDSIPATVIANDVWIGANVIIPGGIRVGDGAIVAAGSVVIKDIPPYTIVGGNPAKVIRKRFTDEHIDLLLSQKWWDWPTEKIRQNIAYFTDIEKLAGILKD